MACKNKKNKTCKKGASVPCSTLHGPWPGFSLLEMMVAMAIAVIIMLAATAAFVGIVKARSTVRDEQQDLENARNAMDTIAKDLRMSADEAVSSDGKTIAFFDDISGNCVSYTYDSQNQSIEESQVTAPNPPADPNYPCGNDTIGLSNLYSYYSQHGTGYVELASGSNSGGLTLGKLQGLETLEFYMPLNPPNPVNSAGRATILMIVDGQSLETTASFRNYSSL